MAERHESGRPAWLGLVTDLTVYARLYDDARFARG
jgi:hypothetical protein